MGSRILSALSVFITLMHRQMMSIAVYFLYCHLLCFWIGLSIAAPNTV